MQRNILRVSERNKGLVKWVAYGHMANKEQSWTSSSNSTQNSSELMRLARLRRENKSRRLGEHGT